MHLIEIFLPVRGNEVRPFPDDMFKGVRETLTRQFGCVTSFSRSPAHGINKSGKRVQHDDIFIMDVKTHDLAPLWWTDYGAQLEKMFAQDEVLIRASTIAKCRAANNKTTAPPARGRASFSLTLSEGIRLRSRLWCSHP